MAIFADLLAIFHGILRSWHYVIIPSRKKFLGRHARDPAGRLPMLLNDLATTDKRYFLQQNRASASAVQAVEDALAKRSQ